MYNQQIQNYQTIPSEGDPRRSEAWALSQAALRIRQAIDAEDEEVIANAVRLNWRLWTILQADIMAPDSPLPLEIKNNILSLCQFVDKQTVAYFAAPDIGMLDVLININRQLAGGLYETPPDTNEEASTHIQSDVGNAPEDIQEAPPPPSFSDIKA